MTAIPKHVALFETTLANKISSSATSLTLVSGTDKAGNALSGTIGFIIDEGTASEEFVLGSVSGTAVTSLTRGLDPQNPATEVTALKHEHRRGATVKVTDYPLIGSLQRILNGTDTIPNKLTYASHPSFGSGSSEVADVKFVEDTANAGAANASTTVKGIVEEATQAEIDADTAAGGTSARLAINPSTLATSKYGTQLPSSGQKSALAGSSGTPGSGNKYVTNDDTGTSGAGKVLRLDGSGKLPAIDGSQLTNLQSGLYKNGVVTRSFSIASGAVTIAHGLGVIPKYVKFTARYASSTAIATSDGSYNGTTAAYSSITFNANGNVYGNGSGTGTAINIVWGSNGTDSQTAVPTFDATNITLTWTKAGSTTTGSIEILWEAYA